MANPSKQKGTKFETLCRDMLASRLGDEHIRRKSLSGHSDKGDLGGLYAHGLSGIAECKDAKVQRLTDWKRQTLDERGNADADFAVLLVHEPGKGMGHFFDNSAYMQMRDLLKVAGVSKVSITYRAHLDVWVRVSVADLCDMIEGIV